MHTPQDANHYIRSPIIGFFCNPFTLFLMACPAAGRTVVHCDVNVLKKCGWIYVHMDILTYTVLVSGGKSLLVQYTPLETTKTRVYSQTRII